MSLSVFANVLMRTTAGACLAMMGGAAYAEGETEDKRRKAPVAISAQSAASGGDFGDDLVDDIPC